MEMLSEESESSTVPSEYWKEEIKGFEYMFDASPLIVNRLREHCYHLTGVHSYVYRGHHAHKKGMFAEKLNSLRELDPTGELFVPESPELGGFGHNLDGALVNIDTLKFYESLIAMNKGGLLEPLRDSHGGRKIVVEIGGGWGGFAYQMKSLLPDTCYVIVDLPQTLLFSAVYLMTLFPDSRSFIYGDSLSSGISEDLNSYDFIFLPHFSINQNILPNIDLTINMVSFQEMTDEQVLDYVRWSWQCGSPFLYSHNRGKSPHNTQLSSDVDSLISRGYTKEEVKVLPIPYTVLGNPGGQKTSFRSDPKEMAKIIIKKALTPAKKAFSSSIHDYRHIAWHRREVFSE
jgi:putative sugar O-methyltransferase